MTSFKSFTKSINWYWLNQVLLALTAFSMPFGIRLLSILLTVYILFSLLGVILGKITLKLSDPKVYSLWILFLILFLLHVVGFFFPIGKQEIWIKLHVRISMVLLPTFILLIHPWSKIRIEFVLKYFIFGIIIYSFACYVMAFAHSIRFEQNSLIFDTHPIVAPWANHFSGTWFSYLIHPSYLAMYINFTIIILLVEILAKKVTSKRFFRNIAVILFLSVTLFLLSSRAGLITWIFLFLIAFIIQLVKNKNIHLRFSSSLFILLVLIVSVVLVKKGKKFSLIANEIVSINNYNGEKLGSVALRIIVWQVAFEKIKEKPLLGYGTGNVKNVLYSRFSDPILEQAKQLNLNVHNQFLETWMEQGIIGLLLLLAIIFYPIFSKKIYNRQLLIYLSIIIFINFFFESMLNRINGVAFFAFFYSLLALSPIESNKEKE